MGIGDRNEAIIHCRYLYHNRFTAGPDYIIEPHEHTFWHSEHIIAGELQTEVAGQVFIQHAGDTILLPPDQPHSFRYRTDGTTVFSVKFEVTQSAPPKEPVTADTKSEIRHVFAALDTLLATQSYPDSSRNAIDCLLASLVYLLTETPDPAQQAHPAVALQVKKIIEQHEGRALTIAAIARELGYSQSHIRSEFRAREKTSLKEYIDRQRGSVAAHYLAYSDIPIKEIVSAMEFADPQCFSRFCRRQLGFSPRQIRQRIAQGSNLTFDDARYAALTSILEDSR